MTIIRKSNVTFDRWPDFRKAVKQMISNGTYKQLASIHADLTSRRPTKYRYRMHGAQHGAIGFLRFLPWHRAYLVMFERELRKINSELALPYWDWDNDRGNLVGVVDFRAIASKRKPGQRLGHKSESGRRRIDWFSDPLVNAELETLKFNYFDYAIALEIAYKIGENGTERYSPHGLGHNWVGGDMATSVSPNDILFWMHHAAIDRIWARWQAKNPGKIAALKGKDAKLDPWDEEFDIHNINDISKLGADSYDYEDPKPVAP